MNALRTLALAIVATLGLSTVAQAQNTSYYGAVIKNNTKMKITYQYKHNNGAWQTLTLNPGQSHQFSVKNPTTPQTVTVRFDNRMGDGKVTLHEQRLCMWSTNDPKYGWLHVFILVNDGKTLALQA